ncbi:hypothetical protein BH10PSE19_BH10PSE19_02440 [soil metagenome]
MKLFWLALIISLMMLMSVNAVAISITLIDPATEEWLGGKPYVSLWCYSESSVTEVIKKQFSNFDPPYPRQAILDPQSKNLATFCGKTSTTFAVSIGAKGMEPKFICDKYVNSITADSKITLYINQAATGDVLCSDKKE